MKTRTLAQFALTCSLPLLGHALVACADKNVADKQHATQASEMKTSAATDTQESSAPASAEPAAPTAEKGGDKSCGHKSCSK